MKLIGNVEVNHVNEVVFSQKVLYTYDKEQDMFMLDCIRSKPSAVENPDTVVSMSREEMADVIRSDYVGNKKWVIGISSGTINIVKKNRRNTPHTDYTVGKKFDKDKKKK